MDDSIGIGVIGTGGMGSRHARNVHYHVGGAHVAGLFDVDHPRASALADECGHARVFTTPHDLINEKSVDAVLIASPDDTHVDYTLACLEARKPVLCEKPLAVTAADAWKVIEVERTLDHRWVMVGFMRRFDPQHVAVKQTVASGKIGRPYLFKGVHRNQRIPYDLPREHIISQSAVHDIDSTRWLLEREIEEVYVRGLHVDPAVDTDILDLVLITMFLDHDAMSTVEVNLSARYGYEVTAEVVGDQGTVITQQPDQVLVRSKGVRSEQVPGDWFERFEAAYIIELNHWVRSLRDGEFVGADAWDGYVALLVSDACVASLNSGQPVGVSLPNKPDLDG